MKSVARHPFIAVLLVVAAGALALRLTRSTQPSGPAALEPRAILNRAWFDKLPGGPRDEFQLAIFFAGGLGVYQHGSAFRFSVDVFDFERQGNRLDVTILHDRSKVVTTFKVDRCDERPPFDLCLDIDWAGRGPRRFYGFASDEDFAARLPWGPKVVKAARAQSEIR